MKDSKFWVWPVLTIALLVAFIVVVIQLNGERGLRKHLEESQKDLMEIRKQEIESQKKAAEKIVIDKQIVIDSLFRENKQDSILNAKTNRYYENEIKRLRGIKTYSGIDRLTDSILRANKVR